MYAAQLSSFGPPANLQVNDVALPRAAGPTEVLICVVASGVNPIEWKIRSGLMKAALQRELPVVFGWEYAGIVDKVGIEVTQFQPGDAVFGMIDFSQQGSHAEYVLVDQGNLARKPPSLKFERAAAVPMTSQAAWSLVEAAGSLEGKRALVMGSGGAVGHWLVQLLKLRGAHVVALASGADIAAVRALGADIVVDYRQRGVETLAPVDVVFDLVGGELQARSWTLLGDGGMLVSVASPPDASKPDGAKATGKFVFTQSRGSTLAQIAGLLEAGRLIPLPVSSVRPLADIADIHAQAEAGTLVGKTVLRIAAD